MNTLREKLYHSDDFLFGIELVSSRGTMNDTTSLRTRQLANDLLSCPQTNWVSITDNPGGNPMLAPSSLGKPLLYGDMEVIIHLSCKDNNRNGIESESWHLASEGFHNILTLSGDAPIGGAEGVAKPVFDIDSVGLLTLLGKMNKGLAAPGGKKKPKERLNPTKFFLGAVVTNFKVYENEVIPQYLKLKKKIECGAQFIINQIGYDSRKIHELICYMEMEKLGSVPLIGNVFVLTGGVAKVFNADRIPGVVVSAELLEVCKKKADSPDKGKAFFVELAAKQVAIYRGLGYRGAYLGGVHNYEDIARIYEIEKSFGADDWKAFARELLYSRPNEFYMLAEDRETGLSVPGKLDETYEASLLKRKPTRNVTLGYRLAKCMHDTMFVPGTAIGKWGARCCTESKDSYQGPSWMRAMEKASKAAIFSCKDCGDCSLPDIAFLCPESQCAKNQRNGPCGGTRNGLCEVTDKECIWGRAYDRRKYEGNEMGLLAHAPVIQNQGLRDTSSWANTWLQRDHHGKKLLKITEKEHSVGGSNVT